MLPSIASAATYGGANLLDYGGVPVVDPTTDRPASGVNPLVSDVAGLTHMTFRAWARIQPNNTGAPTMVAHDATWAAVNYVAPTVSRSSTGVYQVTWPSTVYDEVPLGSPGATSPITLNFRGGFGALVWTSVWADAKVQIGSAHTATAYLYNSSLALADFSGQQFDIFVF